MYNLQLKSWITELVCFDSWQSWDELRLAQSVEQPNAREASHAAWILTLRYGPRKVLATAVANEQSPRDVAGGWAPDVGWTDGDHNEGRYFPHASSMLKPKTYSWEPPIISIIWTCSNMVNRLGEKSCQEHTVRTYSHDIFDITLCRCIMMYQWSHQYVLLKHSDPRNTLVRAI